MSAPEPSTGPEQTTSLPRRVLLGALATVLVLIVIEGALSWISALVKVVERSRPRSAEVGHAAYDPDLGWVHQRGVRLRDFYGPGRDFTTNAQGLRATAEYGPEAPAGRRRVVFLGDSFTMGFGVGDGDTFPAQIERLEPAIQSVNMGMGAYGVGQDYLWWKRDGEALRPRLLVFAFIAHDFQRLIEDHHIQPKPRLALEDGRLVVRNVPVPRASAAETARTAARELTYWLDTAKALSRLIGWLLPARSRRAALEDATRGGDFAFAPVAEGVFAELARETSARGTALLLVYLPTAADLDRPRPVAAWAEGVAGRLGVPFADLTPALEALDAERRECLFRPDGHYTVGGNRVVAAALLPAVREGVGLAP
jgi:hypothetical protein